MLLLMSFTFLAGVVTILSPCVLPILPAILSVSLSKGKWRPLGVVLGLVLSFTFFTLALATLIQQFGFSANFLRYIAILMIGFFGMVMVMPYLSDWFAKITASIGDLGSKLQTKTQSNSYDFLGGFVLGISLGLVWTPCAGPILAAITTLAATQQVNLAIVLLTIAYSLGAGIPLLVIAYGGRHLLTSVPAFSKYTETIRKIFGWIMLFTAFALAFNWDVAFQKRVLDFLPNIQIESNSRLQEELNKLRPAPVDFPSWTEGDGTTENGALPKIVPAPNFVGITDWINSPPLTLQDLKGKVVLIDFWTYSCINCIRTFPYLIRWYEDYKDQGFVIVGVHTPEFAFEKDVDNVKDAVKRFNIPYPVAMDNNYQTWQAYHNSYWPAHYLIDQEGIIRYFHFGEGKYNETENAIRQLLGKGPIAAEPNEEAEHYLPITPETYLGYARAHSYMPSIKVMADQSFDYSFDSPVTENKVGLKGPWDIRKEYIQAEGDASILELNFVAGRVYLVLAGSSSDPIQVQLDGKPLDPRYYTKDLDQQGQLFVKEARKYDLVDLKGTVENHRLTLIVPKGIKAYAFTFGEKE